MNLLWKLAAKAKSVATRGRILHYVDVFAAAFGMALWYDRAHLLDAHGLDVAGCVVFAASVAGAKALLEAYRKSLPKQSGVQVVIDDAEKLLDAASARAIAAAVSKERQRAKPTV